ARRLRRAGGPVLAGRLGAAALGLGGELLVAGEGVQRLAAGVPGAPGRPGSSTGARRPGFPAFGALGRARTGRGRGGLGPGRHFVCVAVVASLATGDAFWLPAEEPGPGGGG